jgi:hypothetical protein
LSGQVKKVRQYYARNITLDLGILTTAADRFWLLQFLCSDDISITYDSETIAVTVLDDDGFANEWADGFSGARHYVIRLTEKNVHPMSYRPSSWG